MVSFLVAIANSAFHRIRNVTQTTSDISVDFKATSGQIDNQLYKAPLPVLLAPTLPTDEELAAAARKAYRPQPLLQANVVIDTSEKKVIYIKRMNIALHPIDVKCVGSNSFH